MSMIVQLRGDGLPPTGKIKSKIGSKWYLIEGIDHPVRDSFIVMDTQELRKCKRKTAYTKLQAKGRARDITRACKYLVQPFLCPVCSSYHVGKPNLENFNDKLASIGEFTYIKGQARTVDYRLVALNDSIPVETLGYP